MKSPAQRLLVQAGYVRPLAQGLFSFLPLGVRVYRNVARIIREEMDRLGGQEVQVPLVNPLDLWRRSGREQTVGEDLIRFSDRSGRRLVLSPTHEEAVVELVRSNLNSYRDLPLFVYQFQTKFRDEERTRCGLVRTKEFMMKDGYSFHRSFTDLNNFFPKVHAAYSRIFDRCGVNVVAAEAGVGYMGGNRSYEFLAASDCGDDFVVRCDTCGYTANTEIALGGRNPKTGYPAEMERVVAAGHNSLTEVATALGKGASDMTKSLVFATTGGLAMAVVRGDREVSTEKLSQVIGQQVLRKASTQELDELGLIAETLSPVGWESDLINLDASLEIVVDHGVADSANLVYGANEPDAYLINVNFGRDYESKHVGDIARVREGDACAHCNGTLHEQRAMELGNIFRLGDYYTRSMELCFREERGKLVYPQMASYGIGLGRLISGIVEQNHDEKGIVWPFAVAPFRVFLMSIGKSSALNRAVHELHGRFPDMSLLDDRHESISTKMVDADLLGIPYRVILTSSTKETGEVELHQRGTGREWVVSQDRLMDTIEEIEANEA
jgi:prolyl-tRNA synthetase